MRVRLDFGQNAHVRAMCARPKLKCANVRACDPEISRNSHSALGHWGLKIRVIKKCILLKVLVLIQVFK